LAVIGNAAEVIGTTPDLPAGARPALRRIETASNDMAQALDLLLALAREDERRVREPVPLAPLVDKAVKSAAARYGADPDGVAIDVEEGTRVAVDPVLLQLVLNNLIGNAFQHARGSALTIAGDGSALMIADTGPGLSAVADPFAPFDKGPDSAGSGLGLTIVKRLCEAGDIALSWRGFESGTQFRLDLPGIGVMAVTNTATMG
jgi:signal transduction histidine kinase